MVFKLSDEEYIKKLEKHVDILYQIVRKLEWQPILTSKTYEDQFCCICHNPKKIGHIADCAIRHVLEM